MEVQKNFDKYVLPPEPPGYRDAHASKNGVLNRRVKFLSEWELNKDNKSSVIELQHGWIWVLNYHYKITRIEYSIKE